MLASPKKKHATAGNALFLILIAVALFAALTYAVTQSGRGSGTISSEQAVLTAAQITQVGAQMKHAVSRMVILGTPVTDVSFEHALLTGYDHTPVATTQEQLFHPDGGGITYSAPPAAWLDSSQSGETGYGQWHFPMDTCVEDVGADDTDCWIDGLDNEDMIAMLHYIPKDVCLAINRQLEGIPETGGEPPLDSGCSWDAKFQGVFGGDHYGISVALNSLDGHMFGCYRSLTTECGSKGNYYTYYHVLYPR
ncbi:MAG: hypothetical protein OXT65_12175 [Alphaproteobacteria bacterium]|nr:hypothetical protein [Alphaproteobacteria bacterium]